MTKSSLYLTTGCLAVAVSSLVIASQATLAVVFDYPNVMSEPTAVILQRYLAAGAPVRLAWFAFAFGALMLAPVAKLFQSLIEREPSPVLGVATVFGIIAGISYAIGIMRWVLLANMLANDVASATTTSAEKATAALVFRAFDVYCGNSFGETIAPLSHGVWAAILGAFMLRSDVCPRWMAWAQIVCGIAIATRPLEYIGYRSMADMGDIGVAAWTVLFAIIGIHLIRRSRRLGLSRAPAVGVFRKGTERHGSPD